MYFWKYFGCLWVTMQRIGAYTLSESSLEDRSSNRCGQKPD